MWREGTLRGDVRYAADAEGIPAGEVGVSSGLVGESHPWRAAGGSAITSLDTATADVLNRLLYRVAGATVENEQEQLRERRSAFITAGHHAPPVSREEQGHAERLAQHQAYLAQLTANGVAHPGGIDPAGMTDKDREAAGLPAGRAR